MSEVNGSRGSELGAGGSGLRARGSNDTLAEYERELKAALSIEPSASFEARVRQRIEDDAARPRFTWTPASGWLAAAASLVIVVGLGFLLQRATPDDPAQPPRMATQRPDVQLPTFTPPAHKGPAYEGEQTPSRSGVGRVGRGLTPRRSAREPEVIVVNQMDAVRRLVAAVADGRLAVPEAQEGPIEPPSEMVIAPLVVKPMPVPTTDPDPVPPLPDIRKTQSRSTL